MQVQVIRRCGLYTPVYGTFDPLLLETKSEDNNRDFRKTSKGVRLENGAVY